MMGKVELSKEVIWEERFNPLNYPSAAVLIRFQKWKKGLDLLVMEIGSNTILIPWFCVDDIP